MLPEKKNRGKTLRAVSLVRSFGLTMGAAILLGFYVGSYLDGKLGTDPWFMVLFVILCIVGAFIKFVQSTKTIDNHNAQ